MKKKLTFPAFTKKVTPLKKSNKKKIKGGIITADSVLI